MISNIITSQIIIDSLLKGIMIVLPFFMPLLVGAIVVMFVKTFIKGTVYNFSLITGAGKRTAKKKADVAGDLVEITSSINDVMGAKK